MVPAFRDLFFGTWGGGSYSFATLSFVRPGLVLRLLS
jgi:hypothetical protein